MAGKRGASSDLNHTNWDQEEEPEEAGTFKRASEDVIKKRVIKTARRRNPIRENEEGASKPNIFGSFTGFKATSTPASSALQFLTNISAVPETTKTNGTSETASNKPQPNSQSNDEEYFGKIKGLNESVSKWIKQHVDKNPLINLTPVFEDYQKYFKEIEEKKTKNDDKDATKTSSSSNETLSKDTNKDFGSFLFKSPTVTQGTSAATSSTFKFASTPSSESEKTGLSGFKFGSTNQSTSIFGGNKAAEKVEEKAETTFKFGATSSTSLLSNPSTGSGFSLGSGTTSLATFGSTNSAPKFSFSGGTPFSFGNTAPTSVSSEANKQQQDGGGEEDEDEPPKVEFKPVEEEGFVYKVRCKVFVKKDGSFGDRGVGTLYLKPVNEGEKTQLIVRAETNLGNLLCNFILSKSLPSQRMGKKDVMLVCIPTADAKPPPVPILLRVKSPEEADDLLQTLEKYKK